MKGRPLSKSDYIRKRSQSFGWTMIIMGGSFFLYYLGLFGGVQGPLNPGNLATSLSGLGITKSHMLIFFLSFFIIAMTWNHIFNLVSYLMASRLTCIKKDENNKVCGAVTKKMKIVTNKGETGVRFKCANGHTCFDANFHTVKKGVVSHTVWVAALLFFLIIMYGS